MDVAHGVGGGGDLPIPAAHAVLGGTAALVLSFAVLIVAWRDQRYAHDGPIGGRPVPAVVQRFVDALATRVALRGVGLAVLAFAVWCAVAGEDNPGTNPFFGLVYVVLWVGLVPASLLLGPAVRLLSPARSVHWALTRALPTERRDGLVELPAWVGLWPGALGLFAFTWLELVSPDGTTMAAVVTWFAVWAVVVIGGAVVLGPGWIAAADPFEVYSTLVGHLSPWARDDDRLVVVSPLRHLARVPWSPGLVGAIGVLVGSTAFDSFRDSTRWVRFRQEHLDDVVALETALLVGFVVAAGLLVAAGTLATTPVRDGVRRRELPSALAHSVMPIVVGYMVAHYLTLLVETGQLVLIQASDPLDQGMNLFGTADRNVDLWLSLHPTFLATVKVISIVLGHVVGAVAAHDRTLALARPRQEVRAQLPFLAVMVAFTFLGLYLIFGL